MYIYMMRNFSSGTPDSWLKMMLCKNPPPIPEKPSAGPKKVFSTTSHVHWSNKKSLNGKPLRNSENDDFENFHFLADFG